MTTTPIYALDIRPGDTILVDPLDPASLVVVADASRSSHTTTTTLALVLASGQLASATLTNDKIVRRVK